MSKFLVVLRYDIEDFSLNPKTGQPELYSRALKSWDQTPLIKKLHNFLKKHNARANFAVSYALLKNGIDFLKPLLNKKLGHIFTWHLHLKWDPSVQKDFGRARLPSCYLGYYKGRTLERLLDMADGAFEKAFGYLPKVNLNACFSSSDTLINSLEQRGYLVQGDYAPNTDYRVLESLVKYKFHGAREFGGGPGAPCYPYAPDQPYRFNSKAGMLSGDMNLIAVPITQLCPGVGLPHQETYQDADFEIEKINELYRNRKELTVIVLAMHPHMLMVGPDKREENISKNLNSLDKVLNYVESLPDMEYANYLDVRRHYLSLEKRQTESVKIYDTGNGFNIFNGIDSLKYQSIGVGEPFLYEDPIFCKTSLAIGQDNGIAEWLVAEKILIGPKIPEKTANKTFRRSSLVTTEASIGKKNLKLPQLNQKAKISRNEKNISIKSAQKVEGCTLNTCYLLSMNMKTLGVKTTIKGNNATKIVVVHRYEINPEFSIEQKSSDTIILFYKSVKLIISSQNCFFKICKTKESYCILVKLQIGKNLTSMLSIIS